MRSVGFRHSTRGLDSTWRSGTRVLLLLALLRVMFYTSSQPGARLLDNARRTPVPRRVALLAHSRYSLCSSEVGHNTKLWLGCSIPRGLARDELLIERRDNRGHRLEKGSGLAFSLTCKPVASRQVLGPSGARRSDRRAVASPTNVRARERSECI